MENAENQLIEIENAERDCRRCESILDERKDELKVAREAYESSVYRLRELCSAGINDDDRPLLSEDEDADE